MSLLVNHEVTHLSFSVFDAYYGFTFAKVCTIVINGEDSHLPFFIQITVFPLLGDYQGSSFTEIVYTGNVVMNVLRGDNAPLFVDE